MVIVYFVHFVLFYGNNNCNHNGDIINSTLTTIKNKQSNDNYELFTLLRKIHQCI